MNFFWYYYTIELLNSFLYRKNVLGPVKHFLGDWGAGAKYIQKLSFWKQKKKKTRINLIKRGSAVIVLPRKSIIDNFTAKMIKMTKMTGKKFFHQTSCFHLEPIPRLKPKIYFILPSITKMTLANVYNSIKGQERKKTQWKKKFNSIKWMKAQSSKSFM